MKFTYIIAHLFLSSYLLLSCQQKHKGSIDRENYKPSIEWPGSYVENYMLIEELKEARQKLEEYRKMDSIRSEEIHYIAYGEGSFLRPRDYRIRWEREGVTTKVLKIDGDGFFI